MSAAKFHWKITHGTPTRRQISKILNASNSQNHQLPKFIPVRKHIPDNRQKVEKDQALISLPWYCHRFRALSFKANEAFCMAAFRARDCGRWVISMALGTFRRAIVDQVIDLATYAGWNSLAHLILALDSLAANPVRCVTSCLRYLVGDSTSFLGSHCRLLIDGWWLIVLVCRKLRGRRTNVSMDHQLDRVYSRARISFQDVEGESVNVILIAHVEGGK